MGDGSGKPPACTITFAAAKSHEPSWQRRDAKVALLRADRIDVRRLFQQQPLYVFVGVALFAVISALRLSTHLWTVLVFSLCIGNLTVPIMSRFERYYTRLAFPQYLGMPTLGYKDVGRFDVAVNVADQPASPPRPDSADFRSFSSALLMMSSSLGGRTGLSRRGGVGARSRIA